MYIVLYHFIPQFHNFGVFLVRNTSQGCGPQIYVFYTKIGTKMGLFKSIEYSNLYDIGKVGI